MAHALSNKLLSKTNARWTLKLPFNRVLDEFPTEEMNEIVLTLGCINDCRTYRTHLLALLTSIDVHEVIKGMLLKI